MARKDLAQAKDAKKDEFYTKLDDIAKELKKYDEALEYYNRAGEIGTYFCDEMDCKVGLYEEMREYEKAYNACCWADLMQQLIGLQRKGNIRQKRRDGQGYPCDCHHS